MSSTRSASGSGPPLRRPLGALLLATVALSLGCKAEETFTVPLIISFPAIRGGEHYCVGGTDGVDTFLIDILAVESRDPNDPLSTITLADRGSACDECGDPESDYTCTLLERRCFCSEPRLHTSDVAAAFGDGRFEGIPDDTPFCVRTMTLRRTVPGPYTGTEGPAAECGASVPECGGPIPEDVQLCALSEPSAVSESAVPIVLRSYYCAEPDCVELQERCESAPDLDLVRNLCGALETLCGARGVTRSATLADCVAAGSEVGP